MSCERGSAGVGGVEEMLGPGRSILVEETVRPKALRELGYEGRAAPIPEKEEAVECLNVEVGKVSDCKNLVFHIL